MSTTAAFPTRTVNGNVAIFDLDGCVANDIWRRGRIPAEATTSADYDEYHAGCPNDPVLEHGFNVLKQHITNGDFIAFCTARPFARAVDTAKWITNHFGIQPQHEFMILMRQDGDNRSALDVKREQAEWIRKYCTESGRKVVAAYDDRLDIARMWKAEGYNAMILDVGGLVSLEAPTSQAQEGSRETAEAESPFVATASFRSSDVSTSFSIKPGEAEVAAAIVDSMRRDLDGQDCGCGLDSMCGAGRGCGSDGDSNEDRHIHPSQAAERIQAALSTFRNRQETYGPNDITYARVMKVLFPGKVVLESEEDHRMFLMVMHAVGKMTRFTSSGMRHADSAHDLINYAAFMELFATEHNIEVIK